MAYIGKTPTPVPLTSSDIVNGIITGEKLNADVISSQTALGAEPADTDEFLISDAGTLKRMDYSHIKGGGTHTLLNTTTVTTDTTNIDFNSSLITATYPMYEIVIEYLSSANSSSVDTDLQLSADNGSSFVSSIDQMSHRDRNDDIDSNAFDIARKDQSDIQIFSGLEDDRPNIGVGVIKIFNPMDANVHTLVTHITCNDVPGFADNIRNHFGCARDDTAQAINFFRIKHSSGDTEKAKVKLYGVT